MQKSLTYPERILENVEFPIKIAQERLVKAPTIRTQLSSHGIHVYTGIWPEISS